jgi:tRNA pseudouridine55 synthase
MISGFIKIDKEQDYTSSDVDRVIKRRLDVKVAGHLGTLDPFATGLLIVAINDACKLTSLFPDEEKEYVATLQLGMTTPSLDTETEVSDTKEVKNLTIEEINRVLSSFIGKQKQIPPLYSAKHYKGKKAYYLAREGSNITLPEMDIEIKDMSLVSYDEVNHVLIFRTTVSKGTYIRVLGKDIAERLGTIGYLTALRRTKIGPISLEGSVKAKDATIDDLFDITSFHPQIKKIECDDTLAFRIYNGQTLKLNETEEYLFMMKDGVLLALYKKDGHVYHCYKGMRHE